MNQTATNRSSGGSGYDGRGFGGSGFGGTAAAWLVVALIAARFLASLALPVFDDAFITFRYARNLAGGDGFVYNPGEWIMGTTSPAFGLLAALFHLLHLPMPGSVIALNILCDVAILLITLGALTRQGERSVGIIFGAAFILSPILARVTVGCMESNLFLLLGLITIHLYHRGRAMLAVAIAALSYFLRPEAVMLVGILCLLELFTGEKKRAFMMGALALLLVLPGLAAIHFTFGSIFPQSVAAKKELPPQPYTSILRQLLDPDPLSLLFLPLAIWGGIRTFRRGGWLRTVTLWGAAYIVAYCIARPVVWPWYGVATYYTVLLLGSFGLVDLLGRVPALARLPERFIPSKWGVALMALLPLAAWGAVLARQGRDPATANIYRPLERWAATHVNRSTTIAAYDIGALGYYSEGHIYDLAGLVWPEAVKERWDYPAIVNKYRPDYLYLFATKETAGWLNRDDMRALYEPIARYSKFGLTDLTIDTAAFRKEWVQDYILLRRRR